MPELLEAADAIVREAADRDPWLTALTTTGVGWATVELERAAEELTAAFAQDGRPPPRWSPGRRDDLLGAGTWISREPWSYGGEEPAPALVLLEPDTEGRLAATLARFGEGVAAVYVGGRGAAAQAARPDATRLGRPAEGPLGLARLVLARPTWGPTVLVLDR